MVDIGRRLPEGSVAAAAWSYFFFNRPNNYRRKLIPASCAHTCSPRLTTTDARLTPFPITQYTKLSFLFIYLLLFFSVRAS